MSNDTATYAFTDVETTGFDSLRNCVITLSTYITDADYNIIDEHHGKFRPDGSRSVCWSDGAEKIHGISWEEAMEFPEIDVASELFMTFIEQFPPLIFVAHNVAFDRRMIKGTLSKTDRHFRLSMAFKEYQDTVKMIKESGLVSSKTKSLGAVCKELGIAHDHHDAKSDAFVLIEIHRRCNQAPKGDEQLLTGFIDRTNDSNQGDTNE
jgi:DNA polymerase III epsilon subunit-like protein